MKANERQRFTSADTSINKDKLPAIYSKADIPAGAVVVDYGCGKYTGHLKSKAVANGWTWYGFDPYNRTPEENRPAADAMTAGKADYIICSNVLNVIDSDTAMQEVIDTVAGNAGRAAIFTVYEGDRSGIGRQTGPDQYQRNEKRRAYADRMQAAGYNVKRRGDLIIVKR